MIYNPSIWGHLEKDEFPFEPGSSEDFFSTSPHIGLATATSGLFIRDPDCYKSALWKLYT